ncbi:MAG: asparagine--tRNA ligase [Desulfovibrionaceae bacterium]
MKRTRVRNILQAEAPFGRIMVKGWARTRRDSKGVSFIELNDGSCLANVQLVVDGASPAAQVLPEAAVGAAILAVGEMVPSPGKGQKFEIRVEELTVLGPAPEDYPLQKKRHSDEFLRTIAHLRPRTNKYGALLRIRSDLSFAIHRFFRERDFHYVQTPVLTGSDCEGAGELFRVTTLDGTSAGEAPRAGDFFGKPAYLTVSGQLEAELLCLGVGDVYTFGPTFRAENSNTPRHAAEFWMVEPEMAFADLEDNMNLAEALVRNLASFALEQCEEDLALFDRFVSPGLFESIRHTAETAFVRITHAEAVGVLAASGRDFQFPVDPEMDLQTEHERFLCEEHFKAPVVVRNYPASIKPFYMRLNDDGATVGAMDVLAPGVGEIVGGSAREERLDVLQARARACGLEEASYWWYLDTRRFGSAPHAGFGMGFERLIMMLTGVGNIRDVIPFPRTPNHLEF